MVARAACYRMQRPANPPSSYKHCIQTTKGSEYIGSPPMWVWPQLVFGGSPPIPHCNWRTLPSSHKALPSPPSPSLLPPTPLGSFCNAPGVRDGAAQSGVGGGVLGGVEGEGPPAVLGARPTSGGTRIQRTPKSKCPD